MVVDRGLLLIYGYIIGSWGCCANLFHGDTSGQRGTRDIESYGLYFIQYLLFS